MKRVAAVSLCAVAAATFATGCSTTDSSPGSSEMASSPVGTSAVMSDYAIVACLTDTRVDGDSGYFYWDDNDIAQKNMLVTFRRLAVAGVDYPAGDNVGLFVSSWSNVNQGQYSDSQLVEPFSWAVSSGTLTLTFGTPRYTLNSHQSSDSLDPNDAPSQWGQELGTSVHASCTGSDTTKILTLAPSDSSAMYSFTRTVAMGG